MNPEAAPSHPTLATCPHALPGLVLPDAFGPALLVVRERDGRRVWQTALARS